MATVDAAAVKKLREMTNAGIMDCKGALAEAGGDFDKAAAILREKGIAGAAKKADRSAADGSIGVYVHTDGKQAALVEVNCETDFVAKNEKFQELCRDIAMQIVALRPQYVRREEVPEAEIEARILQDPQRNLDKIYSNYPQTELTVAILKTVQCWPENRAEVLAYLDKTLEKATAVDGMTGEKGLTGYAVYATNGIANVLGLYARIDPQFLPDLLRRNPRIGEMFRFPLETWCLGRYYPRGAYASKGEFEKLGCPKEGI